MKKSNVIIFLIIVLVGFCMIWVKQCVKSAGPAYKLTQEFKAGGLAIDDIKVNESSAIYEEIMLTGPGTSVKIKFYGNGLFFKNVKNDLKKQKKEGTLNKTLTVYTGGNFMVIVYAEPVKGAVKALFTQRFQDVEEF